jgi:predicted amidohydrolase
MGDGMNVGAGETLRIGLAHLSPTQGALEANCRLVEAALDRAAEAGAAWVVTPELCLTGYDFVGHLGTAWIADPAADPWVARLHARASRLGVTLFLGHPERDPESGRCHNTVFVLGANGERLGAHRKINTLPGIEGWSSKGAASAPVFVPPMHVGLLVCADAWGPGIAKALADGGARILLSPAAWPPEPHGPEGCWADRTAETGLPLFVCNRTGEETSLSFADAETAVFFAGARQLSFREARSALVVVDWSFAAGRVLGHVVHGLG